MGADYATMVEDALHEIAEDTPEKQARLAKMVKAESDGKMPESFIRERRWIGED